MEHYINGYVLIINLILAFGILFLSYKFLTNRIIKDNTLVTVKFEEGFLKSIINKYKEDKYSYAFSVINTMIFILIIIFIYDISDLHILTHIKMFFLELIHLDICFNSKCFHQMLNLLY